MLTTINTEMILSRMDRSINLLSPLITEDSERSRLISVRGSNLAIKIILSTNLSILHLILDNASKENNFVKLSRTA